MEKRAVVAIALSILVLVAWSYLFPPPEPPQRFPEDAPAAADPRAPVAEAETAPEPEPVEADAPERDEATPIASASEERIVVTTDYFEVGLTNRGGRVGSWKLHHYRTAEGEELELWPQLSDERWLPLGIAMDNQALADEVNGALFRVDRQTLPRRDELGAGQRVRFVWSDGRGLEVTKGFTFWDKSWLVDVELDVRDRGRTLPARLAIGPGFAAQEPRSGRSTYAYRSQGVWNLDGRVTRRKQRKIVKEDGGIAGRLRWAGLDDQYFAALILPHGGDTIMRWRSVEVTPLPMAGEETTNEEVEAVREPIVSVSLTEGAQLFVGPKDYRLLLAEGTDHDLEKVVWFATNPFLAWITKYIFFSLIWLHDHVTGNYGLAIILATFVLRLLLFPVNQYSMVAMKKTQMQMQRIQPKVNAIRNRYKKSKDAQSRAKMNEEMMALYRKEGVNPMGGVTGCLPLLAQFPILIGFYNMLTVAVELRGAPFFGWIQDLSQKDPWYVIPVLMAVTMFLQQRMAMSKVKDPMQAQQQKIMMFMPFFFGWICIQMPAGMVLYWFVNNVLGIGQQWLVNRHTGRLETAAQKA